MTVATAIADRLASLPSVYALVGGSTEPRIRVMKLRQGEAQAGGIRVQRISEVEPMHLRGSVGTFQARVQVDSYAPEASGQDAYANAAAIDAAVHGDGAGSGLCGFSGGIGSPAFVIDAIIPVDVREDYDPEELRVVRIMREYMVHWRS
jgi:hypothetical protein